MNTDEKKALDYIKEYHRDTKEIPTHVAIGNHIGKSRQTATVIIKSLVEKGKLHKAHRFGLYRLPTV